MKRFLNVLLICCVLLFSQITVLSQDVPPPPPPQGESGESIGGGAPIGDGTLVLIMLATGYILIRLRKYRLETKVK